VDQREEVGVIPEPEWRGDHKEWKAKIEGWASMTPNGEGSPEVEVSDRAKAVATAVFYTAADFNTLYRAPLPTQINAWAEIFDHSESGSMDWLTPELATEAVRAHFAQSTDGQMLPFHVLREAAFIQLGQGNDNP
jgi:hypothetical protein